MSRGHDLREFLNSDFDIAGGLIGCVAGAIIHLGFLWGSMTLFWIRVGLGGVFGAGLCMILWPIIAALGILRLPRFGRLFDIKDSSFGLRGGYLCGLVGIPLHFLIYGNLRSNLYVGLMQKADTQFDNLALVVAIWSLGGGFIFYVTHRLFR